MATTAPPTEPQPPQPRKRAGLPGVVVALCVALGALIGAYTVVTLLSLTTASVEHRARTFAAAGALRVDAGSSDVTVVAERRRDLRVEMTIQRGMWRGGWQPRVAARQHGRRLQLESHCSVWAHIGVGDCGASFTVRVPLGTRLTVDASSGDVHVDRLAHAVAVDTSSGDVHAEDLAGPLRIEASSGDVHVAGYRGADATVRADSGDVHVEALRAPRRLRAEASSGDVDVAVPDAAYRVAVQTGSGDRTVQVRQDPRAKRSIVVRTGSGDVTVVPVGDDAG